MVHPPFTFIAPQRFDTLRLAYMLDSLVRVSRRVGWNHFVSFHWLRLQVHHTLGNQASKLSKLPGQGFPIVELTSWPHSAQGFSQQIPEGSPPEFSPRAKSS